MCFRISSKLKSLAYRFGLTVVVTNQMIDLVGSSEGLNLGFLFIWEVGLSCYVNLRLFLSRNEEVVWKKSGLVDVGGGDFVKRQTKRQLHVVLVSFA